MVKQIYFLAGIRIVAAAVTVLSGFSQPVDYCRKAENFHQLKGQCAVCEAM